MPSGVIGKKPSVPLHSLQPQRGNNVEYLPAISSRMYSKSLSVAHPHSVPTEWEGEGK